ncbi:MAG: hypothetical protein RJB66_1765 [Pseudomonadota bacterium]|jgi:hypothetical protein
MTIWGASEVEGLDFDLALKHYLRRSFDRLAAKND